MMQRSRGSSREAYEEHPLVDWERARRFDISWCGVESEESAMAHESPMETGGN